MQLHSGTLSPVSGHLRPTLGIATPPEYDRRQAEKPPAGAAVHASQPSARNAARRSAIVAPAGTIPTIAPPDPA